jgi:two-component system, NarL family, sensor histidine kinase DevS
MRISADKLSLMADRMRALLDAGIAISSQLSLDSLLQRLTETAAGLTEARFAALGVIDPTGRELERFLTHGIDQATHAAIGDLPRGRGVLGALIRDATPLRLPDLTADARSVGFPPHHPPMKAFLGVPILLRGVAYGNLYLTEKEGGAAFTEEDEEIVTLLASQAAVAIENARLYEAATRWSRQLESLNEVGNALATEIEPQAILDLVARRLHDLIDARILTIWLPTRNGKLRVDAVSGDGAEALLGLETDLSDSKTGRVFGAARSARVDSVLDDPEIDQDVARQIGARAALWVPLLAQGRAIGVIAAFDKAGNAHFSDADLRLCETFAERAALAVELSQRVARDALRRVVDAQELERRRLARELHDETGQALTTVLLGLKGCEEATSLDEVHAVSADVRELVVQTLQDVRRLAVELRPKALDDFGLVAALERLTTGFAEQTGVAVELESRLADARLPSEIETVLYRIVQEALTNVVKHAQAEHVSIVLTPKDSSVTAVIEDDGRGFSPDGDGDGEGLGLVGMRERVALVDGRLEVESSEGIGTTILVEVPVQ